MENKTHSEEWTHRIKAIARASAHFSSREKLLGKRVQIVTTYGLHENSPWIAGDLKVEGREEEYVFYKVLLQRIK